MTPTELHGKAYSLAREIKEKYLELFEVLLEIERRQIYLGFDLTCLKRYCVDMLQLSPSTAKDFVTVVKKSVEVPALAEAIRSKKTTIYKLRKTCPVITVQNAKDWIDLAGECSTRVIEKAVAMAKPRESIQEAMTYVSGDVLEFKLAVSEEFEQLLKRTKDLMSQKCKRAVSSEEALQELMQKFCSKADPVEKAQRWMDREAKASRRSKATSPRTRYRNARVEHAVNLRDQARCTHIHSNGERCDARRWLEKHHIVELAEGGEHTVENLTTLCSAHHKMKHTQASRDASAVTCIFHDEVV